MQSRNVCPVFDTGTDVITRLEQKFRRCVQKSTSPLDCLPAPIALGICLSRKPARICSLKGTTRPLLAWVPLVPWSCVMRRSERSPSIVPPAGNDQEIYLVLDDFGGRLGVSVARDQCRGNRSRNCRPRPDGRPVLQYRPRRWVQYGRGLVKGRIGRC